MRKLGLLLLAGVLGAGCGDEDGADEDVGDNGAQPELPAPPPTAPTMTSRMWRADVRGNAPSTIAGSSVITELGDGEGFNATIQIRGDEPGGLRPWHVHVGSCDHPDAIVGPDEAYPRLQISADGGGEATVNILFALDTGAYFVDVHADERASTQIACGDLIRQ